jgi:hypothetical protein
MWQSENNQKNQLAGELTMLFNEIQGDTRPCSCGGVMVRVEELPQTVKDQCEAADDKFVCHNCGCEHPVDVDPFLLDYMDGER